MGLAIEPVTIYVDEHIDNLVKWLCTFKPHEMHCSIHSQRLKGTGYWFFQLPEFQTW
jgi:hypothetical protein